MKSYTDLEQSKKLAEILPLESADMCWTNHCYGSIRSSMTVSVKTIEEYKELLTRFADLTDIDVFYQCWSLTALLDILPDRTCVFKKTYKDGRVKYQGVMKGNKELILKDNPIDACYEMILKLNEQKIL